MRILDKSGKSLNSILLMLTPEEAEELIGDLESLDPAVGNHSHINDINYTREITVAIYTPENLRFFSQDVRKAIETEE